LGILIGIAIGVLVSNRLFDPVKEHTESAAEDYELPLPRKKASSKKSSDKKSAEEIEFEKLQASIDSLTMDSSWMDYSEEEYLDSSDGLWSWEDTLSFHSAEDSLAYYEGIQLAKDELIAVKFIVPLGNRSDFSCDTYDELDSLLVDYNEPRDDSKMRVEFWKSPLNYKGYILTRNKLALYGIYQMNEVSLFYMSDGRIEMKYLDKTFIIKCTDKFIAFP
jgi:hypothetical protein